MIRAELDGSQIKLTIDREDFANVKRLYTAFRTNRMPPQTYVMPLNYESIDELRREKVLVTPALAQKARSMLAARKYVDEQKAAEKVEPIKPIPIKVDYSLFNHQIKAFNIALALFGYEVEK